MRVPPLAAVWRQFVWLVAALAAGAGALWFIFAERWSLSFAAQLREHSPLLGALLLWIGMIVIMRLRDRVFPGTEGTGIPQAIAALKLAPGPERSHLLSVRILIGKLLLLTLALFAGATVGREGPTVHVAACCLHVATRVATFSPQFVERGLILAGGAGGIAAAFNAPVAGIIFAIEEIGRGFQKENASVIVRTALVACLVCLAVLGWYLFYGDVGAVRHAPRVWLWVPFIGLGGGLLGGIFARAVAVATPRVSRLNRRCPYAVAAALGLGLAVLALISDGMTYGGGDPEVRAILRGESVPGFYPLAKASASFLALISGIPGGLFAPSLSVGAGLGQLIAAFAVGVTPQDIVLLTMAAYFAGVVQSPLTAAIILVEMTNARYLLLPLLASTVLAYHGSRLVCPVGIYEALADAIVGRLRRSTPGRLRSETSRIEE
ncbi:MAG: chloride channel protein [Candidatus Binatia bacterium]